MLTIFALHIACALHGLPGAYCVGTAVVESNLRVEAVSEIGARGLCQTVPWATDVPRWALPTQVGGSWACARAIREHRDRRGRDWPLYYVCSTQGARKRLPSCVRAAKRIERAIGALMRGGEA